MERESASANSPSGLVCQLLRRDDGKSLRIVQIDGYRVELDLSTQILNINIRDDVEFSSAGIGDRAIQEVEPAIHPTLAGLSQPGFASAAMLAQKAKQVDDRIYAAVELAAQHGTESVWGKQRLLAHVLDQSGPLPPELFAAAQLGGHRAVVPADLSEDVEYQKQAFLQAELRSKPIGFYSWNEELGRIYQQDRMLQSALDKAPELEAVSRAIASAPEARRSYERYLEFVSQLSNPFGAEHPDFRPLLAQLKTGSFDSSDAPYYFIPPSRAHETDLIKKLYGSDPIPDDFSLADELIRQIQSGQLLLHPHPDSGWYDYQTWALECLARPAAMPEAAKVSMDEEHLLQLFRGILALTRETHIKQLELPLCGSAMPAAPKKPVLCIRPRLSSEPTYSYYLRRSLGYRFLWQCLESYFGQDSLANIPTFHASGPIHQTLAEAVLEVSGLFHGAAVMLARELGGLDPADDAERMLRNANVDHTRFARIGSERGDDHDAEQFLRWTESRDDSDVFVDSRMMVPLFFDVERGQTKVWALLGWSSRSAGIEFTRTPNARVFDSAGSAAEDQVELEFSATSRTLPYPVMAEVYVDRLLDRDEFRSHCDQHTTQSAILAALT